MLAATLSYTGHHELWQKLVDSPIFNGRTVMLISTGSYTHYSDDYTAHSVTAARFFGWNQNIQGSCDDLSLDWRICIGCID